jgi:Na+-translocating ferredoxin:NAD+ oxidoreductase RnfG subunit
MKITLSQLRGIIKEEVKRAVRLSEAAETPEDEVAEQALAMYNNTRDARQVALFIKQKSDASFRGPVALSVGVDEVVEALYAMNRRAGDAIEQAIDEILDEG